MFFLIYITSIIHWNEVRYKSIIKYLDISLIIIAVLNLTLNESIKFKEYRIIWLLFLPLFIGSFIMNETLFYYQVL